MKHFIIIATLFFATSQAQGQVEFGVKAGLSSYTLASEPIVTENLEISVKNASYGHHAGIYGRVKIWAWYLEPSILFNSNKVTYELKEYSENGVLNTLKSERYNQVDIPLMAGVKLGFLRLYGGPVGHLHINTISDLIDVDGYEERFQKATYGYQAGLGLNISNIRIDLAYEGNLTAFGDHILIDGNSYNFGSRPERLMATVGYKF